MRTAWKLLLLLVVSIASLAYANAPSRLPFAPGVPAKPHVAPPYAPKAQDRVILYEHADFGGRGVGIEKDTLDLREMDFNDIASSIKLRHGFQARFYEDVGGKGEWFTLNCPTLPIGEKTSDFCELKNLANDVATGYLCELRSRGSHGCVPWWNDRISGVGNIKPADESQPQGRIDEGHTS